jgi:hypothetical protein
MKTVAKLIPALLAVLFLAVQAYCSDYSDLIKGSPDNSKFPDANAIIILSEKSYELLDSGRATESTAYLVKVLNNKGREKYSDHKIPFNKEKEELSLINAGTYRKDLTFEEIEKKAINDVTPIELSNATIYANFLNRVYSLPIVDPGNTIFLSLKKNIKLSPGDDLSDTVYFRFDEPLLRKVMTIVIPNDRKLAYKILNMKKDMQIEKGAKTTKYTLTVTDMPQIRREESMPPFTEIASRVIFSTSTTWDEAAKPFRDGFFKACAVTPEISSCVSDITKNCAGTDEKKRAISIFIAQKVRTINLPLGYDGYKAHSADMVLRNKYGDCRDKTALFITMLKAAGIEAYPALVSSDYTPIEKEVPTLKQFDTILVALPSGDGYRFINPYGEESQYGFIDCYKDWESLVVKPDGSLFTKVVNQADIESKAVNTIEGALDEKGNFDGTISSKLYGIYDTAARETFTSLRGKKLNMYFEQRAEEFCPEAADKGHQNGDPLDLTKNMTAALKVAGERLAVVQGSMMLIKVPRVPFAFARLQYTPSLAKREYPFVLGTCNENSYTLKIKLPAGYRPLYMPEGAKETESYGTFERRCSYDAASSQLTFSRITANTSNFVTPEQYPQFKKHLESMELVQNNLIILKRQ